MFPERFSNLPAYAFPRLRSLLDAHAPGVPAGEVVHMTIGEPRHAFPPWITEIITQHADGFGNYPVNEGMPALLEAITDGDGRVRQSAKRALKDVFRTYDSLNDEETVEALARELESMADEHSGKQREHLLEAKEDAEFALQSSLGRVINEFHEEFGESLRSEE